MSGSNNGNGNGSTGMAKDEHLADEDTPRDHSWKRGDFAKPETVKLALITISTEAEEAIRAHRANRRELSGLRKSVDVLAEQQGQLLGLMSKVDRRTELTEALCKGMAFRVGRTEDLTEAGREARRDHELRIKGLEARNDQLDREEAARHAKLQADIENLKKDVDELEDDVEDTKNKRIVSAETATTVLVQEAFRARLASNADLERESRAVVREERTHDREEKSKLKWWVLGIVGAIVLASAAAAIGRISGHPVELVPLPTPTSPAGHH
jgi:K+/H+ antiporter YhaU regulatory subunit KhtT